MGEGGEVVDICSLVSRDLKVQLEALKTHTAAPSNEHTGSSLYEVYTHTETEKFANLSKVGATPTLPAPLVPTRWCLPLAE